MARTLICWGAANRRFTVQPLSQTYAPPSALHSAGFDSSCLGIVLNAGAYTHYSYAIADAIAAIPVPVVETHISNIHAREAFRATSVIAPVCAGTVAGFGTESYILAIQALIDRHNGL